MVAKRIQIYSAKTTANTFVSQKIESVQFYSCPQAKLSPRFLSLFPGRRELPIPPKQHFLKMYFPEQSEGDRIMYLKKLPILTRVLVTSFDKFHHICNLYIFDLFCYAII